MTPPEHRSNDEDLDTVVDRLVSDRPTLAPVDLDRIKLQVLGRGASYGFVPGPMRRRVLAPIVTMGLMGGGTAGVLAASGSGIEAASSPKPQCPQYKSDGVTPKIDKKTGEQKQGPCKTVKPPKTQKP